jgi:hypothetical protein
LAYPLLNTDDPSQGLGANAISKVETHSFSRIQIPFKAMCPASPHHIRIALI